MTRTLTITAAEWASVKNGRLWLVREGMTYVSTQPLSHVSTYLPATYDGPPAEFVQACAPCETCGDETCFHEERSHGGGDVAEMITGPCHVCRIELVGPCPGCVSGEHSHDFGRPVPVTLGHAYAVGQPLPIVQLADVAGDAPCLAVDEFGEVWHFHGNGEEVCVTDHLAHYGPPESLVGKWAIQLAVTT